MSLKSGINKVQDWVLKGTKFYKNKEDFTADYWVNFTDHKADRKNTPKVEIDI